MYINRQKFIYDYQQINLMAVTLPAKAEVTTIIDSLFLMRSIST